MFASQNIVHYAVNVDGRDRVFSHYKSNTVDRHDLDARDDIVGRPAVLRCYATRRRDSIIDLNAFRKYKDDAIPLMNILLTVYFFCSCRLPSLLVGWQCVAVCHGPETAGRIWSPSRLREPRKRD